MTKFMRHGSGFNTAFLVDVVQVVNSIFTLDSRSNVVQMVNLIFTSFLLLIMFGSP